MKILHLSIIAIVGILIIVLTSVGVFMKKLDDNSVPLDTGVMITGVKENYTLNEPITFSVMVDGYGSGCGDTKAILTKENDSQYKSQVWGVGRQCTSTNPTNFEFNGLSANTTINQAGNYTITASFDDSVTYRHTVAEEKFSVTASKITSIHDTGVTPMSANVTNTNFTINYNIAGNGKILDANMDTQSKSLILSLETTSNGTLTVSVPRALLDSKENNQDTQFIILMDGQEVKYTETISVTARTLTIPFELGTEKIEIIATQKI